MPNQFITDVGYVTLWVEQAIVQVVKNGDADTVVLDHLSNALSRLERMETYERQRISVESDKKPSLNIRSSMEA